MPVAGQVDKSQVWVASIQVGPGDEGLKRRPTGVIGALVKAAYGTVHLHQVFLAVTCQIEELRAIG